MAEHRTFGTPTPDVPPEGPTFDLAGETFRCVAVAPPAVLLRLASAVTVNERGEQVFNAPDLIAYVTGVLVDEVWAVDEPDEEGKQDPAAGRWVPVDDVDRFRELVYSKRVQIPIEVLGEVVLWLSEQYTGRPTRPPAR